MHTPKRACPVCRRLNCTDPSHVRKPWDGASRTRRIERPQRTSSVEVKRRRDTVAAWLAEHGHRMENGTTIAWCPDCHKVKARFVADHVTPIAEGGAEDGPLRVHCLSCSGRQGARLANATRRG